MRKPSKPKNRQVPFESNSIMGNSLEALIEEAKSLGVELSDITVEIEYLYDNDSCPVLAYTKPLLSEEEFAIKMEAYEVKKKEWDKWWLVNKDTVLKERADKKALLIEMRIAEAKARDAKWENLRPFVVGVHLLDKKNQ